MCGIAGIISYKQAQPISDLVKITSGLSHRGPDDEGYHIMTATADSPKSFLGKSSHKDLFGSFLKIDSVIDEKLFYGISHRRFSIIDTSVKGHQPMTADESCVSITFNGEIFNYVEIRNELLELGYSFESESDTEVILKSYLKWGTKCFNKFNGFWAIAIIDNKKLILSRDRFSQKPLYYYKKNSVFYFSSEIESIRKVNPELNKIDHESTFLYLYHDRKDSLKESMIADIKSVQPASFLVFQFETEEIITEKYWEYPITNKKNKQKSINELTNELNQILQDAVKIRLRSDVPIAANLSGGLDSACIVFHASNILQTSDKKLTTHTFDYKDVEKLSEKNEAQVIANHCNSDHEVLYFDHEEVWDKLELLVKKIAEPVHTPAAYVQYLGWEKISKLGYKVILHGASNDELMMGYTYFADIEDKKKIKEFKIPSKIQGRSIFHPRNILRITKWIITGRLWKELTVSGLQKTNKDVFNKEFLQSNKEAHQYIIELINNSNSGEKRREADFKSLRIPFWNNYMDKSMMSIPVEIRFPFLDKNVVEFCFKHSSNLFYNNGWQKYILRKTLSGKLPDEIVWNKNKKGFTSPTSEWIKKNKQKNKDIIRETSNVDFLINKDYVIKNYDNIDARLMWRIINFCIWVKVFELKI